MTHPTPIDEREIDKRICLEVTGWQWYQLKRDFNHHLGEKFLGRPTHEGLSIRHFEPAHPDSKLAVNWDIYVPRFSSDIAAAMQVVEAMRGLGYVTEISACVGYYGVRVVEDKTSIVKATRIIKTVADLSRVICECALIAVEEK
jgi:hypothetical protein